jgi:hypothetical protein
MMKFLWSEVGSPLRNDVFSASGMLMEKVSLSKGKNHFSLGVVADLPLLLGFSWSWQLSLCLFDPVCWLLRRSSSQRIVWGCVQMTISWIVCLFHIIKNK